MGTSMIVGMGEVGSALKEVLSRKHKTYGYDSKWDVDIYSMAAEFRDTDEPRVLHITIPYSEGFEKDVQGYIELFAPKYTVVHSTVPVGTCKRLGVYHSPVRGIHPHLAECMRDFWTYLAPRSSELLHYLKDAGMQIQPISDSDNTEAGKLWSLAKLAWDVVFEKEIYRYCEEKGLDYRVVYKHFTHTYNEGYEIMGMGEFVRPILEHMEGPIGGHCVMGAIEKLLAEGVEVARLVKEFNNGYT